MQLIIKPSQNHLKDYIESGFSCFLLPLLDYSVESTYYFTMDEIQTIRKQYPEIKLFISMNKNMMNRDLENLKHVLSTLDQIGVFGVFYYDVSVLKLVKDLKLSLALVWNQTYMVTNGKTCDYYFEQGVHYAVLSKEITKDEMISILEKTKMNCIVEVLSHPSVAFSKRKLLTHYYHDLGKKEKDMITIFEKVSGEEYYVHETPLGTNFFKKSLVHGSSVLEDLMNHGLSYLLLREDFIDHDLFFKACISIKNFAFHYQEMSGEEKDHFIEEQNRLLGKDDGFFFRKTVYKVK